MTVGLAADGTILLEGICPVDDAELLRQLLLRNPTADVDWRGCEHAHTAILQVLLVAKPKILGPAGAVFLEDWLYPILSRWGLSRD
jgi:hypothetical protein